MELRDELLKEKEYLEKTFESARAHYFAAKNNDSHAYEVLVKEKLEDLNLDQDVKENLLKKALSGDFRKSAFYRTGSDLVTIMAYFDDYIARHIGNSDVQDIIDELTSLYWRAQEMYSPLVAEAAEHGVNVKVKTVDFPMPLSYHSQEGTVRFEGDKVDYQMHKDFRSEDQQ